MPPAAAWPLAAGLAAAEAALLAAGLALADAAAAEAGAFAAGLAALGGEAGLDAGAVDDAAPPPQAARMVDRARIGTNFVGDMSLQGSRN